jgi:hypothetical protein
MRWYKKVIGFFGKPRWSAKEKKRREGFFSSLLAEIEHKWIVSPKW